MAIDWEHYDTGASYDELIEAPGRPRAPAQPLCRYLGSLTRSEVEERKSAAELAIATMGITFTVYTEEGGSIDRAWPFDIIPRIIPSQEWTRIETGLRQRVKALNFFIDDVYHRQRIVKAGVFPRELLANSVNFRHECVGVDPPHGVWAHICGTDLVRDRDGAVYVLEDNLRIPSGVSYMLENRLVTKRVFPELFEHYSIRPVDDYASQLFDMLASLSPRPADSPAIAVLTPGIYNSAYFEHAYLAQQMGAELVEGGDLVVGDDDCVYMRTIEGFARVDVIYRRIDDLYLDPLGFGTDSKIGVPGLLRAWQRAIAHVPQSIYLADSTLAENIAFGVPRNSIDRERVLRAARQAQIAEFIESRPEGYDAFVGERGIRLSGGQRQRIGIARALYKQASVLVLDEATSALDNLTEQSVLDAIAGLDRELTVLLIAHRLTTVRRCDTIVELERGAVVAQGSYDELLGRSQSFRKMVEATRVG